MQPAAVTCRGLDGVPEGVAEVEQRALPALALVGRDHLGLVLAGATDGAGECFVVACEQGIEVRFEPFEKRVVADEPVLDHLGEARGQLAWRQGGERLRIGDDGARLVEGTDHVLAQRMIDRGLAADCRIDLGEQRGRDLHERDAALVAGGDETREVADHPAAERDDGRPALDAVRDEFAHEALEIGETLGTLAILDGELQVVAPAEVARHGLGVERSDHAVGDHDDLPGTDAGVQQLGVAEQPGADVDRVGPGIEIDGQNAGHGRLLVIRLTTWRTDSRPVSMTRSAMPE